MAAISADARPMFAAVVRRAACPKDYAEDGASPGGHHQGQGVLYEISRPKGLLWGRRGAVLLYSAHDPGP